MNPAAFEPERRRRRPSSSPLLLVTNYRGGGIGDFGTSLQSYLALRVPDLRTEETSVDGRGAWRQSLLAATYPGPILANVGLTAWGRSGVRNFSGFSSLGLHARMGRSTIAIIHHAIEVLDPADTGYAVSGVVQSGAHLALRQLANCDLVVFSPRLRDLLHTRYGARSVWLVPLPGNRYRALPPAVAGSRPKVVNAGYWAPYKGIDLYLDSVAQLGSRAEFHLVGQPHRLLSGDPAFVARVEHWKARANSLGVSMPGFLTPDALDSLLSGESIGVLSYTSSSGASASFQMFAERGIPVVATDLPEFRYLADSGAGVILVQPSADAISEGLGRILGDRALWSQLVAKQAAFADRYCWDSFVAELAARYDVPIGKVQAYPSPSADGIVRRPEN